MNDIATWYEMALHAIAAESHFDAYTDVAQALEAGNNRIPLPDESQSYLRLTTQQAIAYSSRYSFIQVPNDASGFSGTLIYDTVTGEYTVAFRSTEYKDETRGGDFQRDVNGADMEINNAGLAFAQIDSMERWWAQLTAPGGVLASVTRVNVVGYSLGGHLAQAFTELHPERVDHTYLFNSAGVGLQQRGTLENAIDYYRQVLADPSYGVLGSAMDDPLYQQAIGKIGTPMPTDNLYLDPRHQWAVLQAKLEYGLSMPASPGVSTGSNSMITQLFGHADHNDSEHVANSGVHPDSQAIFVEDQPDIEGLIGRLPGLEITKYLEGKGDFGNTHSLILIIDTLAVEQAFLKFDPNLSQETIESFFSHSSNRTGTGMLGTKGEAEGDSLEKALDALRRIFVTTDYARTESGTAGGNFGSLSYREPFYAGSVPSYVQKCQQ